MLLTSKDSCFRSSDWQFVCLYKLLSIINISKSISSISIPQSVCLHMRLCVSAHAAMCVCTCGYVCLHMRLCVSARVAMCVCTCGYVCMHVWLVWGLLAIADEQDHVTYMYMYMTGTYYCTCTHSPTTEDREHPPP